MHNNYVDFAETEARLQSPPPVSYYPARLAGTYPTVTDALLSVGFSAQDADTLIKNAAIFQSESVYAYLGDGKGVATTTLPNGAVGLWQACIGLICDTFEEAEACANEMDANLGAMKGSTWAVFEWRQPVSRSLN